MACLNTSLQEYINLAEQAAKDKKNVALLQAKIKVWLNQNKDKDRYPKYYELYPSSNLVPSRSTPSLIKYDTTEGNRGNSEFAYEVNRGMEYYFFEYFENKFPDNPFSKMLKSTQEDLSKAFDYVFSKLEEIGGNDLKFVLSRKEEAKKLFVNYLNIKKINISEDSVDYSDLKEYLEEDELDSVKSYDSNSIEVPGKKTATTFTRMLISSIKSDTKNALGLPVFAKFKDVFNFFVNKLADSTSTNEIEERIKKYAAEGHDFSKQLLEKLSIGKDFKSGEDFKKYMDFMQTMSKYKENIVISIQSESGVSFQNNTEENTVNQIQYSWKSNEEKARTGKYKRFFSGRNYNKAAFKKLNFKEDRDKILEILGIEFSQDFGEFDIEDRKQINENLQKILEYIRKEDTPSIYSTNEDAHLRTRLNNLIDIEYRTSPYAHNENMSYSINGKKMYSNNLYSFLTRTLANIRKIKTAKDFVKYLPHLFSDPYSKNSILVDKARNGRATFKDYIHNGDKTFNSNAGKEFRQLNEPDRLFIYLEAWRNSYYPLLRTADNKQERFLNLGKLLITPKEIRNRLYLYLEDELNYIADIDGTIDEIQETGIVLDMIDKLGGGNKAKRSSLFKQLIKEAKENKFDTYNNKKEIIIPLIDSFLKEEVGNMKTLFEENGIAIKDSELSDFINNTLISNIEQTKLLTGNPVAYKSPLFFFKRLGGIISTKQSTFVDNKINDVVDNVTSIYSKIAKAQNKKKLNSEVSAQTGTQLSGDNVIIKIAAVNDVVAFSEWFSKYSRLSEKEKRFYKNMEEGDGIGWISMDEWRKLLIRNAKWDFSKDSFEGLYQWELQKDMGIEENKIVFVNPFTGKNEGQLKKSDIKVVANSIKIQGFGSAENGGKFDPSFEKCSLDILLPSKTEGKKIDSLRKALNKQSIGIALNHTGKKVGVSKNRNRFYDDKGNMANHDNLSYQDVYYSNISIQLETGSKIKKKVTWGTQMLRHIVSNIFNQGKVALKGGDKIFNKYINANNKRLEVSLKILKDKLGIETQPNGDYVIKDSKRFLEVARQEITRRDLPNNVWEGVERIVNEGFNIDTLVNREDFEFILNSIADKEVMRQKRFGRASYQIPSTGYEDSTFEREFVILDSEGKYLKTVKDATKYVNNPKYDVRMTSNQLRFYTDEDGKRTMQVAIPSYFKNKIKRENITDPRLLRLIGFRIPTQGLNSIEAIEPVFLPDGFGDTIILPTEIVAKAGSDYDIDKMSIYMPNFFYNEKGEPVYIDNVSQFGDYKLGASKRNEKNQMSALEFERLMYENQMAEAMYDLLTHPDNFDKLVAPITTTPLIDLAKELSELTGEEDIMVDFSDVVSPSKIFKIHQQFMEGKDAIPRTALTGTFHTIAQHLDIQLNSKNPENRINLKHNTSNGNPSLGGLKAQDGEDIPKLLMSWINAAVDNAKELVLKRLNAGLDTINVWLFLTTLGVPKRTIGMFMNQPIIKEYLKQKKKYGSNYYQLRQDNKNRMTNKKIIENVLRKFGHNTRQIDQFEKYVSESTLSEKMLENNLKGNATNQYNVLSDFLRYKELSTKMTNAQQITSYDNRSIGKNAIELTIKQLKTDRLKNDFINLEKAVEYENKVVETKKVVPQKKKLDLDNLSKTLSDIANKRDGNTTEFTFDNGVKIPSPVIPNSDQSNALNKVQKFIDSPSMQTFALKGYAGTGKTTILKLIDSYLRKKGESVKYSSPTHRANSVMRSKNKNKDVYTLHALFGLSLELNLDKFDAKDANFKQNNDIKLSYGDFLVIDESSMINDELYKFIVNSSEQMGVKVLFVGDEGQVKPVKQKHKSKAFSAVDGSAELTIVERTGDNPLLKESTRIREASKSEDAFSYETDVNNSNEGVIFTSNSNKFITNAANLFKSDRFKNNKLLVRIVTGTNTSATALNKYIRKLIFGAEKAKIEYNVGEVLMGYSNWNVDYRTKQPLINNGGDYEVTKVSKGQKNIQGKVFNGFNLVLKDLIDDNKKEVEVFMLSLDNSSDDISYLGFKFEELRMKGVTATRNKDRSGAAKAWRELAEFKNSFASPGDITYKDKTKIAATLKYGYAHTIHKSQGGTYEYTFIDAKNVDQYFTDDNELNKQLKYVAVTRSEKISTILHENSKNNIDDFDKFYEEVNPTEQSTAAETINIKFEEEQTSGYRNRTIKNASADATIAIAVDFNSAGEKLTKSSVLNQNKKYIPIDPKNIAEDDEIFAKTVWEIVNELNSVNAKTLNIAGNGIYTIKGKYTQEQIDSFTYGLLKAVTESPDLKNKITSIRTGGQTGFDESGAKAGVKLGIPTKILAPKGWTFRNIEGKDISNEQQFKARFVNLNQQNETAPNLEIVPTKPNFHVSYKKAADNISTILKLFSKLRSNSITSGKITKFIEDNMDNLVGDNLVRTIQKYQNSLLNKIILNTPVYGDKVTTIVDKVDSIIGKNGIGKDILFIQDIIRKGDKGELDTRNHELIYKTFKDSALLRHIIVIDNPDSKTIHIKQPRTNVSSFDLNSIIEDWQNSVGMFEKKKADSKQDNIFKTLVLHSLLQNGFVNNPNTIRPLIPDAYFGKLLSRALSPLIKGDEAELMRLVEDFNLEFQVVNYNDPNILVSKSNKMAVRNLPIGSLVKSAKLKPQFETSEYMNGKQFNMTAIQKQAKNGVQMWSAKPTLYVKSVNGLEEVKSFNKLKYILKDLKNDVSLELYGGELNKVIDEIKLLRDKAIKLEIEKDKNNC